jgi:hypothetical protein
MPLKLSYKILRDTHFIPAFSKLTSHPFKDQLLSWKLARVLKKVRDELDVVQNLYQKLIDQYALKDESGGLVPYENRPGTFLVRTDKTEEYLKALKELEEFTLEVDFEPIPLALVQDLGLTGQDYLALEPFIVHSSPT